MCGGCLSRTRSSPFDPNKLRVEATADDVRIAALRQQLARERGRASEADVLLKLAKALALSIHVLPIVLRQTPGTTKSDLG